jgi:hypothetical protein
MVPITDEEIKNLITPDKAFNNDKSKIENK